jgi:F-type H+-transporting ATPase subunit delta
VGPSPLVFPDILHLVQDDATAETDMPRKAYARRYAQAVFEIALEKKELDRWQADLEKAGAVMADGTFLAAMESPKIKFDDKARLLTERLGDISPLARNLLFLLVSRNGAGMTGDIAAEFRRMMDAYHGVQTAEVTTAVPLDDADRSKLEERLSAVVGSRVVIKTGVDPEILGGVVARVGGKLLDGSTRSRLVALKKDLGG